VELQQEELEKNKVRFSDEVVYYEYLQERG
jgi:hypothetical protein